MENREAGTELESAEYVLGRMAAVTRLYLEGRLGVRRADLEAELAKYDAWKVAGAEKRV
jgi:hypothetical protein